MKLTTKQLPVFKLLLIAILCLSLVALLVYNTIIGELIFNNSILPIFLFSVIAVFFTVIARTNHNFNK